MAARKTADETDLRSYFAARTEPLANRILDVAARLLSEETTQQRQEFQDRIERKLQDGAKFIPRKR
jgi:hypothetical protein